MSAPKGPILFDLEEDPKTPAPTPSEAPPVPDIGLPAPTGATMQTVAKIAAHRPSRLVRWAWRLAVAIIGFAASLWAWDFINGLIARNAILGYAASFLIGAFLLVMAGLAIREYAAFARLARLDTFRREADSALASGDIEAAKRVTGKLSKLYDHRPELEWGQARLKDRSAEMFDADGLIELAEVELLGPLDIAARAEVEAAARQVATVTAIVPLALADLATALVSNLRMIRRVAEIYGGRSGALGNWRLTRSVFAHLIATGAVAVGDDLIGSVAGGGVLAKVSRRFGEGVVNGALTARVGVAAIEVCRPLPFRALKKPRVTSLVQRALTGLFGSGKSSTKSDEGS